MGRIARSRSTRVIVLRRIFAGWPQWPDDGMRDYESPPTVILQTCKSAAGIAEVEITDHAAGASH